MTKTARGYTRLSGGDSETSIERQMKAIRQYSDERDDLELEKIYNEGKRESGWDASREQYRQMLADAEEGDFEVLIVRNGSRIGRDKVERLDKFTDLANKWDVEFHTCKRGYVDPENPTDLLMEVFSATKDDDGKGEEIENAVKAIEERAADPEVYHGGVPRGFQYSDDGRRLVPEPIEFKNFVNAFEMRFVGDQATYSEITAETGLNATALSRAFNDRLELFLNSFEEHRDEYDIDAVLAAVDVGGDSGGSK